MNGLLISTHAVIYQELEKMPYVPFVSKYTRKELECKSFLLIYNRIALYERAKKNIFC